MKLTKTNIMSIKISATYGFICIFILGFSFGIAVTTKDCYLIGMSLFLIIVMTPILLSDFYLRIKKCIKNVDV